MYDDMTGNQHSTIRPGAVAEASEDGQRMGRISAVARISTAETGIMEMEPSLGIEVITELPNSATVYCSGCSQL